ncbi:cytochrome P450 oxidoreductase [Apiospora saccharicola]
MNFSLIQLSALLVVSSWVTSILFPLMCLWITWRLWRFTLFPALRGDDIKELPYWIPAPHTHRFYFGNSRRTFLVTVATQKIYVMTSTTNVAAALRSMDTYDYSAPIMTIMRQFGISRDGLKILREKPTGIPLKGTAINTTNSSKSIYEIGEICLKQQLKPGKLYDDFEAVFLGGIDTRMSLESFPPKALLGQTTNSPPAYTVSLLELVRRTVVESTTVAFLGPAILRVDPTIVDTFLVFDDTIWMMLYNVPRPWSSEMLAAKKKLLDSVHAYLELPRDQRPNASWLATTLETENSDRGVSKRDTAVWLTMLYWTFNTNTWRLCFWVVAYVLHDPAVFKAISEEVLPFAQNYESLSALHSDLSHCNRLNSLYHEVIRLVDSPISIRKTTRPTTTALGEDLPAGAFLMLVHRELMLDEEVWGSDAASFNPERFLDNGALLRSKSYTPFGGGPMLCPGRFMARGEVMVFLALLISRFNVTVLPTKPFPRLDTKTGAGQGILGPKHGDDLLLSISKA